MKLLSGEFREEDLRKVPNIPLDTCLTHVLAEVIGAQAADDRARLTEIADALRVLLSRIEGTS